MAVSIRKRRLVIIVIAVVVLTCATIHAARASVDLVWGSHAAIVRVGDTVNLGLYAVADNPEGHLVSAMDVLVATTPQYLMYTGLTSVGAPYSWLQSGLLVNAPDQVNQNLYDGLVMYTAWARLGQPADVDQQGLLVVTFQFTAEAAVNETVVSIPASYGQYSKSVVYDGVQPNHNITGVRGTARLMIVESDVSIVSALPELKALLDGSQVALVGPIVTRSFDNFFYMEETDRTSGIRVNCVNSVPAEGTAPMVSGVLRTIDGERVLDEAEWGSGITAIVPRPLAMNTRAAATLLPQGLLATVCGQVRINDEGTAVILGDGSGVSVAIDLNGIALPAEGFYVVTGALGRDPNGPVLHVNDPTDLRQID